MVAEAVAVMVAFVKPNNLAKKLVETRLAVTVTVSPAVRLSVFW